MIENKVVAVFFIYLFCIISTASDILRKEALPVLLKHFQYYINVTFEPGSPGIPSRPSGPGRPCRQEKKQ